MTKQISNFKFQIGNQGSIIVVFIIVLSVLTTVVIAISSLALSNMAGVERVYQKSVALDIAEGGIEKALWELKQGHAYTGELGNTSIQGGEFDITVTNIDSNKRYIISKAYVPSKANAKYKKAVKVKITDKPDSDGIAFHYGVQVGNFGVDMENNGTKITGNVYSNGKIEGAGVTKSTITGDVKVVGTGGLIDSIKIGGDAYADIIHNCTVTGHTYSDPPFPGPIALPIGPDLVNKWEDYAEGGGTIEGDYQISSPVSLGPKKINGNLTIAGNTTVTVTGPIWVTGNISTGSNVIFNLDPAFGPYSTMIIADSPVDKANLGKIDVSNNVFVNGSGDPKSFIMLLSTNVASIGTNPAIWTSPNASSAIYYAGEGWMDVKNNGKVKSVVGKGLYLSPNAEILYDTGLVDANFSGGPGGTWQVIEWQEIKAN